MNAIPPSSASSSKSTLPAARPEKNAPAIRSRDDYSSGDLPLAEDEGKETSLFE